MKKSTLMITAVAIIAAGSIGSASVYADSDDDSTIQGSEKGFHRMLGKHKFGGHHFDVLADLLGMSTEELRAQRSNGTSIKDLLEQNGITKDDVHLAMREDFESRLSQKVSEGLITQEEADSKLEHMDKKHISKDLGWIGGWRHSNRHHNHDLSSSL